ncbi:MAG: CocE/NonD family hydrolase [Rhodospirillales bacterium]
MQSDEVKTTAFRISLTDGTRLSAQMWRRENAEAQPAILEIHPYPLRYATAERDEIAHGFFAAQGYTAIRVDTRGSGDSEGLLSDEYGPQERSDAAEVIAWIAQQPWCSGAVGLYGLSWGGFVGLQMAAAAPQSLKAVAVAGATDDRFAEDCHFMGGVMTSEQIGWAATLFSFLTRPPDPEIAGPSWRDLWLARLRQLEWVLPDWLAHPTRDAFWTEGFPAAAPAGLAVPALVAGGTADVFATSVLRMLARQPDRVKAVVGPWAHKFPHMGLPGPAIDWLATCTRWFDRWLKGLENGAESEPALRAFVSDSFPPVETPMTERPGQWVALPRWPDREQTIEALRFGDDGRLGALAGKGRFRIATPPDLGSAGGELMPMAWGADLPGDQRSDDARALVFESDALTDPLAILGSARVRLRLSGDRPAGYCVARLNDVAPDGRATRIALGALNLTQREGAETASPLVPGEAMTVEIVLGAAAHRFAAGHRIRLALSTSYWPLLWPARAPVSLDLEAEGSHLDLPLLPATAEPWARFGPADGAEPQPRSQLAPASGTRRVTRDIAEQSSSYQVSDRAAHTRKLADGLETWGETTRRYSVADADPAAASMEIDRKLGVGRPGCWLSTRVQVSFAGEPEAFRSQVKLSVWENDDLLLEREIERRSPRFD